MVDVWCNYQLHPLIRGGAVSPILNLCRLTKRFKISFLFKNIFSFLETLIITQWRFTSGRFSLICTKKPFIVAFDIVVTIDLLYLCTTILILTENMVWLLLLLFVLSSGITCLALKSFTYFSHRWPRRSLIRAESFTSWDLTGWCWFQISLKNHRV